MAIRKLSATAVLICAASVISVGCNDQPAGSGGSATSGGGTSGTTAAANDEHEHPESMAEAFAMLKTQGDEIVAAFKNETPEDAHDALHEVAHTLEFVTEFAGKQSLGEEDKASVASAVDSLFESFGSLDEVLHGQDGATIEEVEGSISTAMETLAKFAK